MTQDNSNGLPKSDPKKSISDGESPADRKTRPKRRRWLKVLGVLLLLGLVVIIALPWLISTAPGLKLLVATANRWLPGELAVENLSLSWRGPCTVQGITLKDPQDREVASISQLAWSTGLIRAAFSLFNFAEVRIEQPDISLHFDRDGRISLIDALALPTAPQHKDKPTTLPAVVGHVVVENGTLHVIRPDNRTLEIKNINTTINLDTLNHIEGRLDLQTPQDGRLAGEMKINNLAPGGQLRPLDATVVVQISTPQDIPIAELAAFALDRKDLSGKINLNLQANIEQGAGQFKLITKAIGLQTQPDDGNKPEPLDLQLAADVQVDREKLAAQTTLEGAAGNAETTFACPLPIAADELSFDTLLAALLEGKTDTLPQFTAEGRGKLDLARLARTFPALLAIRPDVDVASGTLDLDNLRIRGGREPSLGGVLALSNLVTHTESGDIQWTPTAVKTELLLEPGHGLKIQQAEFSAGFGRLTATGGANELRTAFQIDLTELNRQVSQIVDTGEMKIAGQISGTVDLKHTEPTRIEIATAFKAENIHYQTVDRQWQSNRMTIDAAGQIGLADSRPTEVLISNVKVNADDKVLASAAGRSALPADTFDGQLDIAQADLAYLGRQLINLGLFDADQYTGTALLKIKIRKSDAQGPLQSEGDLLLRDAHVGQTIVSTEDLTLGWSDLSYAMNTGQLKIKTAKLAGSMAHLVIDALDCQFSEPLRLGGNFQGDADLAALLEVIKRVTGGDKPPAIKGQLAFKGRGESTAEQVHLTSDWRIDNLEIDTAEQPVREKQVTLTVDSTLNHKQDILDIARVQLDSQILALQIAGKVTEFSNNRRLALSGEYHGNWDTIMALLHQFAPATAQTVAIKGATGSRFEITGQAYQPDVRPVFKEVATGLDLTWDSGQVYGLELAAAKISPVLRQGKLQIPSTTIPASGEKLNLNAMVDFQHDPPLLTLRERTVVMEKIRITRQLARDLLSRINPIFGHLAHAEGSASLWMQGVELPLGPQITSQGAGQGHLDLRDLKIKPGGLLAEAIALGGIGQQELYAVQTEGVDFRLQNGQIVYENFALIFVDNFDLRFRGAVGFDDTIEMFMSVPVRPALLERFGVRGPVTDYARLLSDARVEIPIGGTRDQPKLDLAKVNIMPLIERAIRDSAGQKAGDLLKGAGGLLAPDKSKTKTEPAKAKPGKATPPLGKPVEKKQQPLDLLRQLEKNITSKPADNTKRSR